MNYIVALSIIFILYEATKIIFIKKYWSFLLHPKKTILKLFQIVYVIFLLTLFLHANLWYYSFAVTITTFIAASKLNKKIIGCHEIDFEVSSYLIADSLISLLLLCAIVFTELDYF